MDKSITARGRPHEQLIEKMIGHHQFVRSKMLSILTAKPLMYLLDLLFVLKRCLLFTSAAYI